MVMNYLRNRIDQAIRHRSRPFQEKLDSLTSKIDALTFLLNDNAAVKTLVLSENLVLVKLTFGPSIYMDPRDSVVAMSLMRHGYWEPENTHFVTSRVRHGVNCIDVGANFGYYTALFRGIVGDTATVLAFEPNPDVYAYLRRTAFTLYMGEHQSNPAQLAQDLFNFHDGSFGMLYNLALGDKKTTMSLNCFGHIYGGSTLMSKDILPPGASTHSVDVDVVPLDSLDIDTSKPGFWKIDAEGSEYLILKGAAETIAKFDQLDIMLEYEPSMAATVLEPNEYFRFIDSLGLAMGVIGANATSEPISPTEAANLPTIKYLHLSKKK